MTKECCVCGNDCAEELESVPMFSDGSGVDGEFVEYMCKEGNGCNE